MRWQTFYLVLGKLTRQALKGQWHPRKACLSTFNTAGDGTNFSKTEIKQLIQGITQVSTDHLTPEIGLHLISPGCALWHAPADQCPFVDPFWAFYWPGGQVLSRFLLDQPSVVRGRSVLDVGSGCGATAIACAISGAAHVTANDICPVAACAMEMNCQLNNVDMKISTENLIGSLINSSVLLLGDMFYDHDFTSHVAEWLLRDVSRDTAVYVGDPGRFSLKEHPLINSMTCVAQYDLGKISKLENNGLTTGYVWKLQR